jgi:3-oxoacyl-[acyl-carrier protein] reductase
MDLGIKNKISLVTASSKGLGKVAAKSLAAEGARVVICARDIEKLKKTSDEIFSITGYKPLYKQADLTKDADIIELVKFVINECGTIHILVTNSGGPPAGYFHELNDAQWKEGFESTILSVVRLIRESIPYMQKQKWGRIINITSVTVRQPIENLLLSNSLRLGVVGLAKTLSNEYAKDNILINNVCPGYMKTDRIIELAEKQSIEKNISTDEILNSYGVSTSIGRIGNPDELASLITFLASEKASYITGTTIPVDGGRYQGY